MIEAYYQENTKALRYCDLTWQIKTDTYNVINYLKEGTLHMITME